MGVHGIPTADAVLCYVAVHVAGCFGPEDLASLAVVDRRHKILGCLPLTLTQPATKVHEVSCASS